MTPTTDDNGRWLDAAIGVIVTLWGALGVLYWKLWSMLATREWVAEKLADHQKAEEVSARQLFVDLIAPVNIKLAHIEQTSQTMHRQNSNKLDRILANLTRERGE